MARRNKATVVIEAKDEASSEVKKAQSSFAKFGQFLSSKFVVTLGDLQRAFSAAFEAIKGSANLEAQTKALELQLARQGQALDGFLAKLDEVAEGTVSNAALIQASSQALLLGIPADQIAQLLEVARVQAVKTGQDTAKAFQDIATGIGRASPLILDNLGIVVKLGTAYDEYAASVGKTAEELTKAEQTQALTNEVLKQGATNIDAYKEASEGLATQLQKGQAQIENFKNSLGNLASAISLVVIASFKSMAGGLALVGEGVTNLLTVIFDLISKLPFVGRTFTELADRTNAAAKAMHDYRIESEEGAAEALKAGLAAAKLAIGIREQTDALDANTDSQRDNTNEKKKGQEATEDLEGAELSELGVKLRITDATNRYNDSLRVQNQLLAETGRQFDQLAAAQGRAAAVSAAVAAGGELILGGTRINLAGGGSRLTSTPGLSGGLSERRTGSYSNL